MKLKILALLVCCWSLLVTPPSWATEVPLRIATFQIDATPPLGSPLCNGNVKPAMEIVSPLTARGIVLLGAGDPIVLCAVDWVGIANGSHDAFREAIAVAVNTRPQRVALHTLHQHDAPGSDFEAERLLAEHGLGRLYSNADFDAQVMQRLAVAAQQSLTSAQSVSHLGLSSGGVERVASNRRILGSDGRVAIQRQSSGGKKPAAREAAEGTIDPLVRLITFWSEDRPLAVLTYYATHPQSYYGQGSVNWDFVGYARQLREQAMPGVPHIHFNGAGGNVAAGKYNDGSPKNRPKLARRLAQGMERAWDDQRKIPIGSSDVQWFVEPVALPLRETLNEDSLMETLQDESQTTRLRLRAARDLAFTRRINQGRQISLTRLRLGDASVLHMPGELFVEYQLAAQAMRPDHFVAMAAYGDYGPGYIGTQVAYSQGGYETGIVSRVAPSVEQVLMTGMEQLLDADSSVVGRDPSSQPTQVSPQANLITEASINADSESYDSHPSSVSLPDGTTWIAWHAYRAGRDQVKVRRIDAAGHPSATWIVSDTELARGAIASGPPTIVTTAPDCIWVVWTCETESGWRVLARKRVAQDWQPAIMVTPEEEVTHTFHAIHPTAVAIGDGELLVAWSEYRDGRFGIRTRRTIHGDWQRPQDASSSRHDAFRPVLAADEKGNAFVFWDRDDGQQYNVMGRRLLPQADEEQQISPVDEHCLTPTALMTDSGPFVAWLQKRDIIGGTGVISQWHTLHAAAIVEDRWKLILDDQGESVAAELTQGLVAKVEPRPAATGGYLGRRAAPMLWQDGDAVWLMWERKTDHDASTTDVLGDLLARPIRELKWHDTVQVHTGYLDYHLVHDQSHAAGRLVMLASELPRQTKRLYHRLVGDVSASAPFQQEAWTGWREISLPVASETPPRQSIQVDGQTYQLYWADMHCHSALTADAEGEQDELTQYARLRALLDVVVFTNNDFLYDVPLTQYEYALGNLFASVLTRPGEFLSLPGYEWTSRIPGVAGAPVADPGNWTKPYQNRSFPNHRSVIYPPAGGPLLRYPEVANDIHTLNLAVAAAGGITMTQHDAFQPSGHPVEVGMELTSGWRNYIDRVPELFHQPLHEGARLGFMAHGDSHRRTPGLAGALTGIYCPELTADAVLDALRHRRCFATNGSKILIDARANDAFMGQPTVSRNRAVDLSLLAIGTREITSAVLVRNGQEIKTISGNGTKELKVNFRDEGLATGNHWYYWRVSQQGEAAPLPGNMMVAHGHLAWSTPHFVDVK